MVQDPFSVCDRCQRLKLECKIESNFKRVGKRSKNAEMEREIMELRRQLASNPGQASATEHPPASFNMTASIVNSPELYQQAQARSERFMAPDEAVAGLLDLRQGLDGGANHLKGPSGPPPGTRKLENIPIPPDRIEQLFQQ